ncbi:MAG TPA: holo-ACP synthase [Candidatus Sabulitectum sp.]|nr:holo-ACP synthase [Candidatus Sabulitectum sp.]HPJ29626.1 holo-ACP synthase [Candidatus Sabulitectum sp.]HPR23265.1 holo-ACP synthase [Candidatus Sabulitectum sp.]HRW77267.1 holo-ACP synthase [Candidatus Sabulitectum sp.]
MGEIKGVGIDLVDIETFRAKLTPELIDEVFLPEEKAYCSSQTRSWENYAARFAAKEAVFKALGHGLAQGLRFRQVEVVRDTSTGAVSLRLSGRALEVMKEAGVKELPLSLSHTRKAAIAIVIAQG